MRYYLLFLLFFPFALWGQDTSQTKAKDTLKVKYLLSSDLSVTAGNLKSFTTVNKGQLDLEKRVWGLNTTALFRYGTLEDEINSREFNVSAAASLFPKNRVYGFINGGYEFSFLRGFDNRAFGGAGISFRVFRQENNKLETFFNALYEFTEFNAPIVVDGDTSNTLSTARGVLGWTGTHKVFSKKLIITHAGKFQQSLQNLDNYRFEGNVNLTLPIFSVLSVKTGVQYTYENIVLDDRQNSDFIWTFGVVLTNI